MRMKFLRIFPEICANTWCLFSSSTRNIALGRGSSTVAITSIASSLGKGFPRSIHRRHLALQVFAVEYFHNLASYFSSIRTAVDQEEPPGALVIGNQGI